MRKLNKVSEVKRDILTRYIECKVMNGEYIKDMIGKPLRYWDYDKILMYFEGYVESDIYCPDELDKELMRQEVAMLNIIENKKVAKKLNNKLNR